MPSYRVFTRNWWKRAEGGGLEPNPRARKTTVCHCETEEAARDVCRVYNLNHSPGRLSRKAEYTRV